MAVAGSVDPSTVLSTLVGFWTNCCRHSWVEGPVHPAALSPQPWFPLSHAVCATPAQALSASGPFAFVTSTEGFSIRVLFWTDCRAMLGKAQSTLQRCLINPAVRLARLCFFFSPASILSPPSSWLKPFHPLPGLF